MDGGVTFTVWGDAAPYRERSKVLRPRGRNGYIIISAKDPSTKTYQDLINLQARAAMAGRKPIAGAVRLEATFHIAVPPTWPKYKRTMALAGDLYPCPRPDLTNLVKCIEDAMSGLVFEDDAHVVDQLIKKRYAPKPFLNVTITHVGANPKDVKKQPASGRTSHVK